LSAWLYWGSDIKVEQVLTSKEWRSTRHLYLSEKIQENSIFGGQKGLLSQIKINIDTKFLPNNTYLRNSFIEMFKDKDEPPTILELVENGTWELTDNYLLVKPKEFKDTTPPIIHNSEIDEKMRMGVKALFIVYSEENRRVDIINHKTILLTGLGHDSRLMISN
jgi:transmembrane regulatory protein ToxS